MASTQPRQLKPDVQFRTLPHRQPEPTEAENFAVEVNTISVTESDSPVAIAVDSLHCCANYTRRLKAENALLRQEVGDVGASKASKAADRRLVTKMRTGTIKERSAAKGCGKGCEAGYKAAAARDGSGRSGRGYEPIPWSAHFTAYSSTNTAPT